MKKLTNQQVKCFKDMMTDLLNNEYYLDHLQDVYIKINYKYDKDLVLPVNTFSVKVYYKIRKASATTYTIYYFFFDNLLASHQQASFNQYGGISIKSLGDSELTHINTICKRVKEFYKAVEHE